MTTAKTALQELSSDSVAQRPARQRITAMLMHRHLVTSSVRYSRAEGRPVAERAVRAMCGVLGNKSAGVAANSWGS